MTITLPWPPAAVSPNARVHFMVKARAAKSYRRTCWALALESKAKAGEGPIRLGLTFRPPNPRKYDRDNAVASIKNALDGLADALRVNDSRFEIGAVSFVAHGKPGYVAVEIAP